MQLKCSPVISFFEEMLKKKYNFDNYTDIDKPCLFFGVYRKNDLYTIIKHKGKKIIWFTGSDAIKGKGKMIRDIKPHLSENSIVIAESDWIERDFLKFNINYKKISLFLDNIYNWQPIQHGKSLYWYNANTSKYGKEYLPIIRKALPNLNIIINESHSVPREKISEIYSQCFIGFRPIEYDGMSMSVGEMGLMGRYTIYNGNMPFAIKWNSIEEVIQIIKKLQQGYNYKLIAKRTREFFKENERKWCDLVLHLCGIDEIDACGIFSPSHKRPASIFRIMRTNVVNNLSKKFGDQQWERPYIVEQLDQLGLKQLITNKNSGFVAGEFKGVGLNGNKGYPKDFKDFYTYDSKYTS